MSEPVKVEDRSVPGRWWTLPTACPKCHKAITAPDDVTQLGKPFSRTRRFMHLVPREDGEARSCILGKSFVLELPPRPVVRMFQEEVDALPKAISRGGEAPPDAERWLEPRRDVVGKWALAHRGQHPDLWALVEPAMVKRDPYFDGREGSWTP